MSRYLHAARAWDLFCGNTNGLTRLEAARLFWSHLCGMVKP